MLMKLTKRDITLLGVMVFVLIVVLFGKFLILPQIERHTDLESTLMDQQEQKDEIDSKINSMQTLQTTATDNQAAYETATENYYPMMKSYETERMITQIILNCGLESQDFEISSTPYLCSPVPYFASELALTSPDETKAASDALTFEPTEEAGATQSTMYGTTVTVTANGSLDHIKNLINIIYKDYPAIRITNYSINSNNALTADNQAVEITTLDLGLEIYMCQK